MNHAYVCTCQDSESAAVLRERFLTDHLAYIETVMDQVFVAGALRDEADQVTGSCLIYHTETRQEALDLLRADPYFQAGVWQSFDCRKMRLAAGTWIGGAAW